MPPGVLGLTSNKDDPSRKSGRDGEGEGTSGAPGGLGQLGIVSALGLLAQGEWPEGVT